MSGAGLLLALLAAAVKAGLLLGLAAGLVRLLRRASARARHGIWAAALAGALLVPVLSPWLPAWSIAALPAPALATGPGRLGEPPEFLAPGRLGELPELLPTDRPGAPIDPVGAAGLAAMEDAAPARRGAGKRVGDTGAAFAPADAPGGSASWGSSTASASTGPPSAASAARARLSAVSPAAWLLGLWLAGFLAGGAGLLRSVLAARRLERGAAVPSAPWRTALAEACRRVGVGRRVRLLHSPAVATPMTWGLLRPVILLPAAAAGWSAERRRIVLLHELVHVRRADWLVRLLGRLACWLYWPNPLAWAAARRLAVEQEMACDEEVVALGTLPSSYAGHLLAIARSLAPGAAAAARTPAHALDMARRSQMEGRLMSILDGNRATAGGRKLAILALLVLAGLVPALAAIQPWDEARELSAQSSSSDSTDQPSDPPSDPPAASISGGDTDGVARVVAEIEALERQMEPFEAELEGVERQMEPIKRELEGIEVEIDPVEVELEGLETELEPFEEMIAAVEAEMEPHHARLAAIAAELEPLEGQLGQIEVEMGPFEEQLEAIEVEMQPLERRLEEIETEIEPLQDQLERLSEQMEPAAGEPGSEDAARLVARMTELQRLLEPVFERMAAVHEELEPLHERLSEVHQQMEPLHERMGAIHEQMEPVFARMAALHEDLEPLHERMGEIHEQMEPVHERMSEAHERMAPIHERMGERHERLEPHHRRMGEIHQRMEPLHEEMGRRHEELERELVGLVERILARQLASVTPADTDYAPAAARIVDEISLRVDDGTLRVMSSAPRLRAILAEALGGQGTASADETAAAIERAARAIGELEVAAP